MTSPVREQTDMVRKAFIAAGYTRTQFPALPRLESCHSSRVDVHGVPCVETFVAIIPGATSYTSPDYVLDSVAANGLVAWQHGGPDEMLKALGRSGRAQLVEHIETGKYRLLLPVPDAQLPERLWEPTSEPAVRTCKRGTITVAESLAGWTVTGEHKTFRHKGKAQTFCMRIRRCGCASVNDRPEPKLCHCVLRPGSDCKYRGAVCHRAGHAEGVAAYVDYLARTYA